MTPEKIDTLLPLINSKRTGTRAAWILGPCPLGPWRHGGGKDKHPSFGVKSSKNSKSLCKCMSCGFGGDLHDLLIYLSNKLKKDPRSGYSLSLASEIIFGEFEDISLEGYAIPEYGEGTFEESVTTVFPESWLATFYPVAKFPEAMTYLQNRGLPLPIVKGLDVRFDPVQRRVAFPFRGRKGDLVGLQGRALDKSNPLRYYQYGYHGHRNSHCWMGEDTVDLDKPVILLEGPFDLASVLRVYQNVAASFTSGLSKEKVLRMADATDIITFYDHGHGGDEARKRIAEVLLGRPITHIIPSYEEGDAGAMSVDTVKNYLKEHVKLRVIS